MSATYADEDRRAGGLRERRSGADRRYRQLQAFCRQFTGGRRIKERRREAVVRHCYVDIHGAGLLLVILLTMAMCIGDAYMTLTLLNAGAVEINPVMEAAIDVGWEQFFYFKYAITACSLIILLMHKNCRLFGTVSGQHVLLTVLITYIFLMSYEITLLVSNDLSLMG